MRIEQQYKEYIKSHWLETKESALRITDRIQNSELNAGGNNYTRTLQIPKFFTRNDYLKFKCIVEKTYTIFEKVIKAYRNDSSIRSLFPFSKELEELMSAGLVYHQHWISSISRTQHLNLHPGASG